VSDSGSSTSGRKKLVQLATKLKKATRATACLDSGSAMRSRMSASRSPSRRAPSIICIGSVVVKWM